MLYSQIIQVKSLAQGHSVGSCHRQIQLKIWLPPPRGMPQIKSRQAQDWCTPQEAAGITHPSHWRAGLRRPRREKGAALTGSGPSPRARGRRALLDLGPSRPQGPAPPNRTQHSAASWGSAGGGEAKDGGFGGRRGWVAAGQLPDYTHQEEREEKKTGGRRHGAYIGSGPCGRVLRLEQRAAQTSGGCSPFALRRWAVRRAPVCVCVGGRNLSVGNGGIK